MEYLPVKGEAKIGFTKEIIERKEIIDHKNFPRFTNKIETTGGLFREKKILAVLCDGKGNIRVEILSSETERTQKLREDMITIAQLAESRDNGHITQAQFEDMRNTLVENMKKDM